MGGIVSHKAMLCVAGLRCHRACGGACATGEVLGTACGDEHSAAVADQGKPQQARELLAPVYGQPEASIRAILKRPRLSKADILGGLRDVRFTPKSGHSIARSGCPLCAISRHMQCTKFPITSSAMAN